MMIWFDDDDDDDDDDDNEKVSQASKSCYTVL